MRLYLIFILLLFSCISQTSFAFQNSNQYEYLQTRYEKALTKKEYNKALAALNRLGDFLIYKEMNHKEGYRLLREFKPLLSNCSDTTECAKFYINYAEAATYAQDYKGSVVILEEGIRLMEQLQDSSLYEYGYAYLKSAENTNRLNRFTESANYFQKAEVLFTHQQDTLMLLWTKSGLSTLFSNYAIYDKAAEQRAFIFQTKNQENYGQVIAIAHLGAASDAFFQYQPELELYHIERALQVKNNQADIQAIVRLLTLSYATAIYSRQQQKEKANYYYEELSGNFDTHQLKTPFINSYYQLAKSRHALVNKRYPLAERHALKLLKSLENTDDWQSLARAYWLLANIYEQNTENAKALEYFKRYAYLKDSVNKAASRRKFAYVQTQFETQKKDLAIRQKNKDIQLLHAENRIVNQRFLLLGLVGFSLFVFIYIWRQRLYAIRKEKLQKEFAQNLIRHLEDERKRIAGELHDSIGQNLLLIKNKLLLGKEKDTGLVEQTINEVRNISQSLHPFQFEKLGVLTSIRHTLENFQRNSSIFYSEDIQVERISIDKEKEIFIYRMLQECLTNVEKHSKAKACRVEIKETLQHFIFVIQDNGVGFDVKEKMQKLNSLGLKNLKERAQIIGAQLIINSEKENGTLISIYIPKNKS